MAAEMSAAALPTAWRRMSARVVDSLWIVPAGLLVWRVLSAFTEWEWWWHAAVTGFVVSSLQVVVEPLFISTMGATPGKMLGSLAVVDGNTGQKLNYRDAMRRTLKVAGLGFGFWIVPIMAISLPTALWRMWQGRSLPWDRSGRSGCVRAAPRRLAKGTLMLVVAAVPGWLLPLAVVLLGITMMGSVTLNASQDISRALTGQWTWLHRLSGESIPLDTEWRLVHDYLSLRRGHWTTVFAFGVGDENRVLLEVQTKSSALTNGCLSHRFSMEEEGFVFLDEFESEIQGERRCTASGGRPGRKGVVHAHVEGYRGIRGDYTVTRVFADGDESARKAVDRLASRLIAERADTTIVNGHLTGHYWRNDLTGVDTRLPADWEFEERRVDANGSITFIFSRSIPAPRQTVYVMALPLGHFGASDPHQQIVSIFLRTTGGAVTDRRSADTNETLSEIRSESKRLYVWTLVKPVTTWAAMWQSPESDSIEDLNRHPLLARVRETLR